LIVLDTNVVSEPTRPQPDPVAVAWLRRQAPESLFLTTTSLAELLLGIELLPLGRRRNEIEMALVALIRRLFGQRVLPFDQEAARIYAERVGKARAAGRAIAVGDGQIAAVAAAKGFSVATRDTAPFIAAGLSVINPWLAGAVT
jgi:predicted nucleic acid-binding protein